MYISIYISINYFNEYFNINKINSKLIIYIITYILITIFVLLIQLKQFSIKPDHILDLGKYRYLLFITCLPSFLIIIRFIKEKDKKKGRKIDIQLLITVLIPIIGSIISIPIESISLLIPSYTLSLISIYIYRSNIELYNDPLTGIYNRKILEDTNFKISKKTAILFIDIDKFKSINDIYGHDVGDKVLKDVSSILKNTIRDSDYPIRIGGDEFIIICSIKQNKDIAQLVKRINNNIEKYNKQSPIPISLSIGEGIYNKKTENINDFIKKIDEKMYAEKKKKIR
ncbi:MAG: GGDEF domain-containing protein [bacterium]|nr:GGDEF domain-containing protein [bacterium]